MDVKKMLNDITLSLKRPREAARAKLNATLGEGITIVLLCAVVASAMMIASMLVSSIMSMSVANMMGSVIGIALFVLIGIPMLLVFALLTWLIGTGLLWLFAKILGGTGKFSNLAGAYAYPAGGIMLVNAAASFFNFVPYLTIISGLVLIFISFYALYLEYVYVMEIMKLSSGKAILAVLLPMIIFTLLLALLLVALILSLGVGILATIGAAIAAAAA